MPGMTQLPEIPEDTPIAVVPDGRGNMVIIWQDDAGRVNRTRILPTGETAVEVEDPPRPS